MAAPATEDPSIDKIDWVIVSYSIAYAAIATFASFLLTIASSPNQPIIAVWTRNDPPYSCMPRL